ncbi:MAG: hypothetical protein PF448_01270 [Bacteroidales bacterium]|jgi:hypothetical protein|nr:hypothetical protein [Bacteroidales bacterium]
MKRLNDIPKKDPFKAPDGYFETLPDKVRDRIQAEKQADAKPGFFAVFKPYLYFAGFFIALAFLFKVGLNTFTGDYHDQQIIANQTETVESEYFEYDMISEETIYAAILAENTDEETEIPEETMIAYLTQDDYSSILYYE